MFFRLFFVVSAVAAPCIGSLLALGFRPALIARPPVAVSMMPDAVVGALAKTFLLKGVESEEAVDTC